MSLTILGEMSGATLLDALIEMEIATLMELQLRSNPFLLVLLFYFHVDKL